MKIKNVSGQDLHPAWMEGRLVFAGQEVEVPDADVEAYVCQPTNWVLVKAKSSTNKAEEVN